MAARAAGRAGGSRRPAAGPGPAARGHPGRPPAVRAAGEPGHPAAGIRNRSVGPGGWVRREPERRAAGSRSRPATRAGPAGPAAGSHNPWVGPGVGCGGSRNAGLREAVAVLRCGRLGDRGARLGEAVRRLRRGRGRDGGSLLREAVAVLLRGRGCRGGRRRYRARRGRCGLRVPGRGRGLRGRRLERRLRLDLSVLGLELGLTRRRGRLRPRDDRVRRYGRLRGRLRSRRLRLLRDLGRGWCHRPDGRGPLRGRRRGGGLIGGRQRRQRALRHRRGSPGGRRFGRVHGYVHCGVRRRAPVRGVRRVGTLDRAVPRSRVLVSGVLRRHLRGGDGIEPPSLRVVIAVVGGGVRRAVRVRAVRVGGWVRHVGLGGRGLLPLPVDGLHGIGAGTGAGAGGAAAPGAVPPAQVGVRALRSRGPVLAHRGRAGSLGRLCFRPGPRLRIRHSALRHRSAQLEVTAHRVTAVRPGTGRPLRGDGGDVTARPARGRTAGLGDVLSRGTLRELTLERGGGDTHGRAALDVSGLRTPLVGRYDRRRPGGLRHRRGRHRGNLGHRRSLRRRSVRSRWSRSGGHLGNRSLRRLCRTGRRVLRVPGGRRVVDGELARRLDGGLRVGLVIAGCGPAPADPVPIAVHSSSWCGQAPSIPSRGDRSLRLNLLAGRRPTPSDAPDRPRGTRAVCRRVGRRRSVAPVPA